MSKDFIFIKKHSSKKIFLTINFKRLEILSNTIFNYTIKSLFHCSNTNSKFLILFRRKSTGLNSAHFAPSPRSWRLPRSQTRSSNVSTLSAAKTVVASVASCPTFRSLVIKTRLPRTQEPTSKTRWPKP